MDSQSAKESAAALSAMFGLSLSVCLEILKDNKFEVDRCVDEILTMKSINGSIVRAPPVKEEKKVEDPESIRQMKALELEAKTERDRQDRLLQNLKNAPTAPRPEEKKPEAPSKPAEPAPLIEQPKGEEKPNLNVGKASGRDRDILYASVDPAVYAKHFLEKKRAEEAERNRQRNEEELERQKAEIARIKEQEKELEKKKREAARLEAEDPNRIVAQAVALAEKEKAALRARLEAMQKEKEELQARLESQKKIDSSEDEMKELQKEAKAFLFRSLIKPSPQVPAPASAPVPVAAAPEKKPEPLAAAPEKKPEPEKSASSQEPEAEFLVPGQNAGPNILSHLASLGQKSIQSNNEDVPLVQLYFDSTTSSEVVKKAVSFVMKLGVSQSEVRSLDITEDFELKGFLKSQHFGNDFSLPFVFIKKSPLGTYDEVKTFDVIKFKDCLTKARSGFEGNPRDILAPSDSAQRKPQLTYLDSALGGVETVLSYLNPFSYFRGSPNSDLLAGSGETLFDVLHTNWYGRHLERKFKFLPTAFLRLHSKYGDIRATRPYSDIESIERKNSTFLAINYKNGSSPDWLQATEADTDAMFKLLQSRAPNAKFVDEKEEE